MLLDTGRQAEEESREPRFLLLQRQEACEAQDREDALGITNIESSLEEWMNTLLIDGTTVTHIAEKKMLEGAKHIITEDANAIFSSLSTETPSLTR